MTSVQRKNIRQNAVDSPKKMMPTNTVHTAPMPPHTAYPVPRGIAFSPLIALSNINMLMLTLIKKEASHNSAVLPLVADILSKLNANAASNSPPIIRNIQFDIMLFLLFDL